MPGPKPKPAAGDGPFVAELRSAIADSDLTHCALAREADCEPASIRRFLSRERTLTLPIASRLAEALGLKVIRSARKKPRPDA